MPDSITSSTVLVVDDAPDSLSLISDTLDQVGVNCLLALNGKKAISIAEKIKPDLILLDAIMPIMDGFETCSTLKNHPALADIPVIFMTCLSETDDVLRGLDAGAIDYLTKPVHPKELLARIRVHLHASEHSRKAYQALEGAGQNLLRVNGDGDIVWNTPQTLALFSHISDYNDWLENSLPSIIKNWLNTHPRHQDQLNIEVDENKWILHLVTQHEDDTYLLKVSIAGELVGEKLLWEKLNITKRESEVLYWIAAGKTNKEISEILSISDRTVNKHLEQIYTKLGVENRTSAAAIAIRILN